MKKICFVCHGNICRSPMAEYVLKDMVDKLGLTDYEIVSKATSYEEIGNDIHYGTKNKLDEKNISYGHHESTHLESSDYNNYDYFIGMDSENIRNMNIIFDSDSENKIIRLLDLTSSKRDIADPWYSDNFEQTYLDVYEGCIELIKLIEK